MASATVQVSLGNAMPIGQEQHSIEGYRCELFAKARAAAGGAGCPIPNVDAGGQKGHLLQILHFDTLSKELPLFLSCTV